MRTESVVDDLLPVVEGMIGGPTHEVVATAPPLCDRDIEVCVCSLLPTSVGQVQVRCTNGWVTVEGGAEPWIEVERVTFSIPGVTGLSHHL